MRGFRYARWDGKQNPIGDELGVQELVDSLSEDILGGLDPEQAFRRMMRRGVPGAFGGLQSLLDRLRRARQAQQERGRLDGWLDRMRDELDRILTTERGALAERTDDDARMNEMYLDSLPDSTAGRIGE